MLSARPPLGHEIAAHAHFNITHMGVIIYQNLLFPPESAATRYTFPQSFGNLYLGIVPFLLALPLYGQWHNKVYRFYLIVAGFAALLSFWNKAFHGAQRLIPGFGFTPVQPLEIFFLCIIVAFGLTVEHILKTRDIPSRLQTGLIIGIAAILSIIPFSVVLLRAEPERFVPNYAVYIISLVLILIAILVLLYKLNRKFFISILVLLLCVNLLAPMKRWMIFYGPDHSLSLRCKNYHNPPGTGLSGPRYFDATGTAYMASNVNIYPRLRLVQGYDSLVLRHFAAEYDKHIPKGVRRGRRLINKPGEAPEELLRKAGVGKIFHNPTIEDVGSKETIGCVSLITSDVSYPECTITNGTCSIKRISPERIEIKIETNTTADLKVAEVFHPAWRYRFDNKGPNYRVQCADDGFMEVPNIPAGTKTVQLFYSPWLEKLGLTLALLSLILSVVPILWIEVKRK
jgi:hypothetical protein